jgi:sulfotransferase
VGNKTYHFLAGLPRSGNTMLSAILNQNPRFYSSPISSAGLLIYNMIKSGTHETYSRNIENVYRTESVFRSIFDTYYSDVDKTIIFDRAKQWGDAWSMAFFREYLTNTPKIIFTTRDIDEILASFLLVNNGYLDPKNVDGLDKEDIKNLICDNLMLHGGEMMQSIYALKNLILKENRHCLHIVEYNDLVFDPEGTMKKIYDFLGEEPYAHDFNNIIKVELDNEAAIGLPENLHAVEKSIKKSITDISILPDLAKSKYSNMEFWREI